MKYRIHNYVTVMSIAIVAVLMAYYTASIASMAGSSVASFSRVALWVGVVHPEDARYHIKQAVTKKTPLSGRWIRTVRALHRGNADILFAISRYYEEFGDTSESWNTLVTANSLDPFNKEMRNAMMQRMITGHRYADMARDVEARGFEGLDENSAPWLYDAGLRFFHSGDLTRARELWWAAAEISPSSSHIWIEYANILHAAGKDNDAMVALDRCEKDIYAGPHCRAERHKIRTEGFSEPGAYSYVLSPYEVEL